MRISRSLAALTALLVACASSPPARDPAAARPAAPAAGTALQDASGGPVRTVFYGESLGGRPLRAEVLAFGDRPLAERRGLLVVAALDGRRSADARMLRQVVEDLADRDDLEERLGDDMLVFVPLANPAGWGGRTTGDAGAPPATRGNGRPLDRDRDGRVDEDGPTDLDGDGKVTWMRVPDGAGEWVVDEHDPRAMRKAKRAEGERGTHRLLREGLDDDGDGAWHEDDGQGVMINENFPHGWDEHPAHTGQWAVSEPETRALVDLVLAHPGLLGVVVVGDEDTLVSLPEEARTIDRGGWGGGFRSPLDGLMEDDVAGLEEMKRRFDELLEEAHDVKGDGPADGGLLAWSYHQAGRWPIGLRPWATPETLEKEKEKTEETEETEDEGAGADENGAGDDEGGASADRGAAADDGADDASEAGHDATLAEAADDAAADEDGEDEEASGEEAKEEAAEPTSDPSSPVLAAVLQWYDRQDGLDAFVPWTAFDHPELGEVEIGGLTQDGATLAGRTAEGVEAFRTALEELLLAALGWFPEVVFEDLEITDHGGGLYTVEVAVVNAGVLPTSTQLGADARLVRPMRVRLELPDGVTRVHGPRQELVRRLEGAGGREELRWTLSGARGARLRLTLDADTVEDLEKEVILP